MGPQHALGFKARVEARDVRTILRQALGIAFVALLPAVVSAFFHPKRPDFANRTREGEITVAAATAGTVQYFWIDARAATDYEMGHVPEAMPLNEDHWDDLLPAVLQSWPTGPAAVVYCDSRQCEASEKVAKRLREFNVAPVFVLKGGWDAWLSAQKKQ